MPVMKRREVIALLGGAAAWPLVVRAQQPNSVRRVGVLMSVAADHPDGQPRLTVFKQGLQQFGWIERRNLEMDVYRG